MRESTEMYCWAAVNAVAVSALACSAVTGRVWLILVNAGCFGAAYYAAMWCEKQEEKKRL